MAWIRSKFTLNVKNKFSLLKHSSIYGFILIYLLNEKKLLPHFNISNEFTNTFFNNILCILSGCLSILNITYNVFGTFLEYLERIIPYIIGILILTMILAIIYVNI
jgi:hypothetical protein